MILLFGGTTEGRKTVEVLEESGSTYYYSTKTGEQELTLHHGRRLDGAMDAEAMAAFCREHAIGLLVDAAHPFASQLHQTVAQVAARLGLPVIRFERLYPERDPSLTWIEDYDQVPRDIGSLLATTGVQSISRLKPLEAEGMKVYYRILSRPSSVSLAHRQGATDDQLCYYEDGATISVDADAILLKESGLSGGFAEKVEAARRRGMRIIVLKRPATPASFLPVNGPYGLRRMVERLLPAFFPLKSGLTTGTCATAAAIAATLQLLKSHPSTALPAEVAVTLPNGETISVPVGYGPDYAYCIKQAGDDPDVTDGLEIRAQVAVAPRFEILGGEGVGRFTLPGFDYPPGEAAINRVPRQMIQQNLQHLLPPSSPALSVTISVPDGERLAGKTFNPRLGIEGGISIIGVSGIVKPFSEEAFIESIRKCMEVAKASGSDRVVMNSGAKSERFVRSRYPDLPQQAFVEYGNYIGQALAMAHELGFPNVTLGVMLGKAVKLAAGHLDTHSRRSTMDRAFIGQMLSEAGCPDVSVGTITLARELWDLLSHGQKVDFARVVVGHCLEHCQPLVEKESLTILLIDDEGNIYP